MCKAWPYFSRFHKTYQCRDFIASDIARDSLQKMVKKFVEEDKPSFLERFGLPHKSARQKAKEMLRDIAESDVKELKASVENLEDRWKENNGPVSEPKPCNCYDHSNCDMQ